MDNLKLPTELVEPVILAHSVNDLSYFMKIKKYLQTTNNKSYFNDEKYQFIFNLYCKYFDKNERQPKKSTLLSIVDAYKNRNGIQEELFIYYKSIINDMYSTTFEEYDKDYIEEITIDFIKQARAYETIIEAQNDINERNYEAIVSKMENAVRINLDKNLGLSIKDFAVIFDKINEETSEGIISSGYHNLDNFTTGFSPKTLTIFSGTPGTGKTLLLGNLAINAFFEGKKVIFYTFETALTKLMVRLYANLTGYSKGEIVLDQEGTIDKLNNIFNDFEEGDLIIKEYNANEACSSDLLAHIRDLKMYNNWEPDIIFVDYILIMRANDPRLSQENSYKYYKTVSEELRNIGKTLNIPIVTASQINREGMSDRGGSLQQLGGKQISESRGIYDTADIFIPIAQGLKDKENNRFYLIGDKVREGESGWRIQYDIDYEHMKITEGAIVK